MHPTRRATRPQRRVNARGLVVVVTVALLATAACDGTTARSAPSASTAATSGTSSPAPSTARSPDPPPPTVPPVPVRSAALGPAAQPAVVPPVRLTSAAQGIDLPIDPVGVASDGQMQIPPRADRGGWYQFGAAPGDATGTAVITAHVDSIATGSLGPFAHLKDLVVGDTVEVTLPKKSELPADIVAAARALWARGEQAGALSILYRGALAFLQTTSHIDFPEGATEQECVSLVRTRLPDTPPREAFSAVARAWQRCAYAHRLPSPEDFQALTALYANAFIIIEDVAA